MRIILAFLIAVTLSMPSQSSAQTLDIEAVISGQIEAFQRNDLDTAFSFASPHIKRMFGNSARFGLMVQRGYPMVWRPSEMRFGPVREVDGRVLKTVFFTDARGQLFEASYEMIQIKDVWQINGVQIRQADLGA